MLGGAATVLAVGTNWTTGIVKVPPLLRGYVDVLATVVLIVLPFAVGFSYRTNALLFYVIVGAAGLRRRWRRGLSRRPASEPRA